MSITGKNLIEMGFEPGKFFTEALEIANKMYDQYHTNEEIKSHLQSIWPTTPIPVQMRETPVSWFCNLNASNEIEQKNLDAVTDTMNQLMRIPTIESGAIMPDACPAGVIPVGGVVAAKNAIHPGLHSADVCCSMYMTVFNSTYTMSYTEKNVLDKAFANTFFGTGIRRDRVPMPSELEELVLSNPWTAKHIDRARRDFATQGDGNHFLFVGNVESSGNIAMVTHHGSRGFGAKVYKDALKYAKEVCPCVDIPSGAEYISTLTLEGQSYLEALDIIKEWTYQNHKAIHDLVIGDDIEMVAETLFNPHNFVFNDGSDLFYHAKGATPSASMGYDTTLVPMNMGAPILVTAGSGCGNGIGFLPHGAGRNLSRSAYFRDESIDKGIPTGIDIRSFSGKLDASELPQAYKSASTVENQMVNEYGLAEILDRIIPYGSIMAGEQPKRGRRRKS